MLWVVAGPAAAQAQGGRETPLLEVDLRAGTKSAIDKRSAAESELDAALGQAIGAGERSFSTKVLEQIEERLVGELRRERPRATPGLIIFLYPGSVSAEKLRSLAEVAVDIELVIDPCERTVCREAVARHIELVGRAVQNPVVQTPRYKLSWKTLIIQASVPFHDTEHREYRVPIADCVAAAGRRGGGLAWLDARSKADTDYEPMVAKAISQAASRRRVSLGAPPLVNRSGDEASVHLRIHGDRIRFEQQVTDALAAAASGLRANPATPAKSEIEVRLEGAGGDAGGRLFRSMGPPVGLFLDGKLGRKELWSTYVIEAGKNKGAQVLAFNEGEARGHPSAGSTDLAGEPDDAEAVAVLSAHFAPMRDCARAEAAKNSRFAGVTLVLRWQPDGRATEVTAKEAALRGGELARCLGQAVASIRLPRFGGAPRTIEFPIRVKGAR
jgi:hypothetical protein